MASKEQTQVEIMMQHGEYAVFVSMSDGSLQKDVKDPFFFRDMKLDGAVGGPHIGGHCPRIPDASQ